MEYIAQQIMNALSFGAEYALLALGLAIVFSSNYSGAPYAPVYPRRHEGCDKLS